MADFHALLRRQLRKQFATTEPPESMRSFVEVVNQAYLQADDERMMMERAFKLSSQELLDANAELAAALEALRLAAEQSAEASRAKDEFLAMLGHELRNPLAPIVTTLDVAKLKGVPTIDARDIERPVRQVLRLVDDLLDIARVARGSLVLERRPLELALAVRNAVEAIQPAVTQRGHLLRVDVPAEGLVVDGDEARLTQVVTNLLINSVRYTDPGGAITVRGWRDGDQAILQVRDNGQGIDAERLPHIFDSFGKARPPGGSGLGLGLTIVHNLVALHGGTATAHSDGPGRGATFEVRLRTFAVPAAPGQPAPGTPTPATTKRRKILVVDDNREAANLIGEALRLSGHEVAIAYRADEALLRVAGFTPDVALLDVGLAGMSGHHLGEELRQRHAAIKLVAITGYGQPSDREASRRAGFAAHLVKPVGLGDLLEVVGG
ncbi:MAG TPA: hybrid sensor histidine kinase/response regulator [Polyangia bacterium]|nr:hybrid sensor histidine kinase/response regulator [Polyangia bacterium]